MVAAVAPGALTEEWRPFKKQERFLRLSCFEALFGGAAGPGKTVALVVGAFRNHMRAGYQGIILRRVWEEAEATILPEMRKLYAPNGGVWNGRRKCWSWTHCGGGEIFLGHAEHEQSITRYDGRPFQFCGFDELTHFTEFQYRFMTSRLRSMEGIPVRLRAGSNPGGPGHDWVLRRFAPWIYPVDHVEYEGPRAAPGEVLWFRPKGATSDEEEIVPANADRAKGRTMIPALLSDNPILYATEYKTVLEQLDPLTRAQKKDGDWLARPGKRVFFKREWFDVVELSDVASDAMLVRWWDRAATADPKADYTVGLLLAYSKRLNRWWIVDVVRGQWEPADVRRKIAEVTEKDSARGVRIALARDPASAGKFEAMQYMQDLAGSDVHSVPEQRGGGEPVKIVRIRPVSAQAEAQNIRIVRGHWNRALLDELEGFPDGNDDQADSLAGAFRQTLTVYSGGMRTGGRREQGHNPAKAGGY